MRTVRLELRNKNNKTVVARTMWGADLSDMIVRLFAIAESQHIDTSDLNLFTYDAV